MITFDILRSLRTKRTTWAFAKAAFSALVLATAIALLHPVTAPAQTSNLDLGQSDFGLRDAVLDDDTTLLIEADSVVYDFDLDRIALVGAVRIYYGEYTLRAQRVVLERTTGRVLADGGVVLTEPGGSIIQAADLNVSDTFGEGFVRQLDVETIERSRFTAESAVRSGDETAFTEGSYTACNTCDEEGRRPIWRIKAKTIIHNQKSRTVYYENATFELWGIPIAYLPFLSHPDPTVRRKTGFLVPSTLYSDDLGFGVRIPYYWSIAPNMDITFAATPLTRQGAYFDGEFRHRLETGQYRVSVGGISQADPSAFSGTSGNQDNRGGVRTVGEFDINTMWKWGWDLSQISDRAFVEDYSWEFQGEDEAISTLYLEGQSDRNRLSAQAYAFRVLQEDDPSATDPNPSAPFTATGADLQNKQPIVHPVIDHQYILDDPFLGGQFSYTGNFTSLTRNQTDAFGVNGTNFFRGVEGTFTRASAELDWRRQFVDGIGQLYTPFVQASGDVYAIGSVDSNVGNFNDGDVLTRGMVAAGLNYSFPILVQSFYGSSVFEPMAQIIARPNETLIGDIPNEDAQSLVFDDTNLFSTDKFSGFDRVEGGVRANLGIQVTSTLVDGTHINALFGRSLHIAGRNSFATPDVLASSLDSGLESDASDWVGRLLVDTTQGVRMGARARFDADTFNFNRAEVQASAITGPLLTSVTYAFIRNQPNLGITEDRQELLSTANLKVSDEWRMFGSLRYDIEDRDFVRGSIGVGYDDDEVSWSLAYTEDRTREDDDPVDRTLFFRLGLRTLGTTSGSTGLTQ